MNHAARCLLLLGCLALVGAGAEQTLTHQQRIEAFEHASGKLRDELHLYGRAMLKRYPTPEITLVPDRPLDVAPGQVVRVRARGRIPRGALVLFDCDELEVISFKQTSSRLDAKVKVPLFTAPKLCRLRGYTPVSDANVAVPALQIAGKYLWKLSLSNGMRAELTTTSDGSRATWSSTWYDGEKPEGERAVAYAMPPRAGPVTLPITRTPEDNRIAEAAWQADPRSKELDRIWGEKNKLMNQAWRDCQTRLGRQAYDDNKLHACDREAAIPIQAKFRPLEQPLENAQHVVMAPHPVGCQQLVLTVSAEGAVTGKGYWCHDTLQVDVTGTVSASVP